MCRLIPYILTSVLLSGCQSLDGGLSTARPTTISARAAGAIAGDMASRLTEQIGAAGTTALKMSEGSSDYAVALKAALKGWGYTVVADQKGGKGARPVDLAYSIDTMDGQVLARISTPSIWLSRAYTATEAGATPTTPLSIMHLN